MVASEQVVAEQTAARADFTAAAEAVDDPAVALIAGANAPVAVIREDVQLVRVESELRVLR